VHGGARVSNGHVYVNFDHATYRLEQAVHNTSPHRVMSVFYYHFSSPTPAAVADDGGLVSAGLVCNSCVGLPLYFPEWWSHTKGPRENNMYEYASHACYRRCGEIV
jgi:hypothetical protein